MGLMDALQDPLFWRDVRRNAKDLGQSASNAALSNVTGPVDMANSLLGLLGMKSAEPVGGAKWAERVGLSKPVSTGLPQVVGETLGLVAPFAGARAPQVANKLLEYTDNAMAPSAANQAARNQLGAIVYHGSPHKFDRFDASKIGTGEGAQAYGHGLYFAESPGVAKSYADSLSQYHIATKDGVRGGGDFADALVANAGEYPASLSSAIRSQANKIATDIANGKPTEQVLASMRNGPYARMYTGLADAVEKLAPSKAGGSLYKVDLPDNAIARMLDWDKPLSQQAPEVQAAFVKLGADGNMTGQQAYRAAHEAAIRSGKALPAAEKERQSVEQLRRAGIPGIRYLDGGSRGAGAGTSNYVVFPGEESLLKILERNGMAP